MHWHGFIIIEYWLPDLAGDATSRGSDCMTFKGPFKPKPFCNFMVLKLESSQSGKVCDVSKPDKSETDYSDSSKGSFGTGAG